MPPEVGRTLNKSVKRGISRRAGARRTRSFASSNEQPRDVLSLLDQQPDSSEFTESPLPQCDQEDVCEETPSDSSVEEGSLSFANPAVSQLPNDIWIHRRRESSSSSSSDEDEMQQGEQNENLQTSQASVAVAAEGAINRKDEHPSTSKRLYPWANEEKPEKAHKYFLRNPRNLGQTAEEQRKTPVPCCQTGQAVICRGSPDAATSSI